MLFRKHGHKELMSAAEAAVTAGVSSEVTAQSAHVFSTLRSEPNILSGDLAMCCSAVIMSYALNSANKLDTANLTDGRLVPYEALLRLKYSSLT
jgi:hypothetical protein